MKWQWEWKDFGYRFTVGRRGATDYYESITDGLGCGIVGRNMYDAAGAWGGTNPFPGTLIVLTHRTEDQPDSGTGFLFIDGFDATLMKARELAGDGGVSLGGGADLIRQGLAAGVVDELAISTAPLMLGGGKRLFEGFEQDLDLEVLGTWSSQYATHVRYAVKRAGQPIRLTRREYALLQYLATHRGKVVSRSMILANLFDGSSRRTSNFIDVHIRSLRVKLDKGFERPLIQTSYGEGYYLSDYS